MTKSSLHVDVVACYLLHLKPDISPIKLHKSLYFLFAYYGATKNHWLFNAKFEAWKFGSVIREVYENQNSNYYNSFMIKDAVLSINNKREIKLFIEDLFTQIDSVSDFTLVERNHQDEVWKNAYRERPTTEIDKDELILEYEAKYL
ncbi:DUF4065 domain-containing protein [Paenibacillus sp. CFBP 13594]|uniref:Panacea domain-containing protein n=1 Tax=Paenibacillus sp. CFBP 13594 TaxID=2774037 RepID=UPI00178326E1|nr:type II toxin-antitoxin system antitoxin SocA domain-containing protein [Paenibacillus sp. CFBP 13594]MBD8839435.1 DUF4065 domain-containing protein [Paenibacillus sp. CFBP 13594]